MAEFIKDQSDTVSVIPTVESSVFNTAIETSRVDTRWEAMAVNTSIDLSVETVVDPVDERSIDSEMTTVFDSVDKTSIVSICGTTESIETNIDPVIECNMDPEIESSDMDPDIEMEQEMSIPRPLLSPQEIEQAKKCQLCKTVDWKYTCPRCLTHTCSLGCVKRHKSEAACSGIRDKTSYVPMRQYNESNMMSGKKQFMRKKKKKKEKNV